MPRTIEASGRSIDEAIFKGLKELEISIDEVEIDIIQHESKGILGIGAKPAIVKLIEREPEDISLPEYLRPDYQERERRVRRDRREPRQDIRDRRGRRGLTMSRTPPRTRRMPRAVCQVKASPRTRIPLTTPTTGTTFFAPPASMLAALGD